jgi:hypothetical protein
MSINLMAIAATGAASWSGGAGVLPGIEVPFLSNCLGWFEPGLQSVIASGTQIADYGPLNLPATLFNSPTLQNGYISFPSPPANNAPNMKTQIFDPVSATPTTSDLTVLICTQTPDTLQSTSTRPVVLSNAGPDPSNPVTGGKNIMLLVDTIAGVNNFCLIDTVNNGGAALQIECGLKLPSQLGSSPSLSSYALWKLYAFTRQTVAGVCTRILYNLTDGSSVTMGDTRPSAGNAANPFRIPQESASNVGGEHNTSLLAFWNFAASAAQLGINGPIQSLALRRLQLLNGITVQAG